MREKQLLMGNEAIALGALGAGVRVVTGYPGTPSTEVLETISKHNNGKVYVEWSVNEKVALEVAAGAAYTGARAMVTMKQVGLNVASDPLMSLVYIGVKGGMVIVVADDPGPISSQTEQDTRQYARFAKLPVFDPSTPEEACAMVADAFDFSEKYGTPVILRPTTRVCHSCTSVGLPEDIPHGSPEGFIKDSKWVIFPRLSFANHKRLEGNLVRMSEDLSAYPSNRLTGSGKKGIACGGVSYTYVKEALQDIASPCKLLKVSAYPFPKLLARQFIEGLEEVLVIEELDPVIEDALISLCGECGIGATVLGKRSGHVANAGENSADSVAAGVRRFLGLPPEERVMQEPPPLPVRPPVLCAGCPHRASFFAVKEAAKGRKAVYSGDIGCYTLGNAQPLDMVDTCLCMGAGITIAQGIHRVEPDTLNFAFIGDSTFFHTGIPGIINAVYNQTDIIIVILDNATTAMTGNQPHPGTGKTMMGSLSEKLSIHRIVSAIGVQRIVRANPFRLESAKEAVRSVLEEKGVRVVLFEAPCIAVGKAGRPYGVDREACTGCRLCIKKLGCPALVMDGSKPGVDQALCSGCGICAQVCPVCAIREVAE